VIQLNEVILEELRRAKDDMNLLRAMIAELMGKVAEVAGGVRLMEEKINSLQRAMEQDRTQTTKQMQQITKDVEMLMAHRDEVVAIKQRSFGIVTGIAIAAGLVGAGVKTVVWDLFK
jgi:predicted  nucleic acid-binding Zn-ribbon protein